MMRRVTKQMEKKTYRQTALAGTAARARIGALTLAAAFFLTGVSVDGITAQAAENAATAIKLTKAEGAVSILSSSDRKLTMVQDMRLYNGYQVKTGEESYAWLELDGTKLAKVDAVSKTSLRKRGKKLEILLDAGNVFFNVTEPLKEDESLNIRTATMVAGIRGTSGWVEVVDGKQVKLAILEGSVEVRVTDPITNETKLERVSSGETAVCQVDGQAQEGEKCSIQREEMKQEDVKGFVLEAVAADAALAEKIFDKGGLDLREVTPEQAQTRLKSEVQEMHQKIVQVEAAVKEQEAKSAPSLLVWGGNPAQPQEPVTVQPPDPAQTLAQAQVPPVQPAPTPNPPAPQSDPEPDDDPAPTPPPTPTPEPATYLVTLIQNAASGAAYASSQQSVTANGRVSAPTVGRRIGYQLDGWYTDAAYTQKYDFSTPVSGNMTLYAKWTEHSTTKELSVSEVSVAKIMAAFASDDYVSVPKPSDNATLTIDSNLTIPKNQKLTVDVPVEIRDGVTVTVETGASLVSKEGLTNKGNLVNQGTIQGTVTLVDVQPSGQKLAMLTNAGTMDGGSATALIMSGIWHQVELCEDSRITADSASPTVQFHGNELIQFKGGIIENAGSGPALQWQMLSDNTSAGYVYRTIVRAKTVTVICATGTENAAGLANLPGWRLPTSEEKKDGDWYYLMPVVAQ